MLPDYISKAVPNARDKRAAWYVNTAPSYAGIFLWVAFYQEIATKTLSAGGVGVCLAALATAGVLCYFLFYYSPAMLGMKTGYPLYVVGSSTFGATGGYLMPGLLMGLLQIGWFAVCASVSTGYILKGFGMDAKPLTLKFTIVAVAWGLVTAYIGVKGIQYVAKASLYLSLIAFLMILLVFINTKGGIANYKVADPHPYLAFALIVQIVVSFFATAGAAGADFGMNSRHEKDVRLGGLIGITAAILYAGGLPLMSVAGAHGMNANFTGTTYDLVIPLIGGFLATAMFFLFAIASIAPACFCAFIAGNSFSTMLPRIPRMASTMVGAVIGIALAATGVAGNLVDVFKIVGASFGPICGAMTADYLLSGRRWAGPRQGINWAGYIAWALGFVVGIVSFLPVSQQIKSYASPEVLYSYIIGFVVYVVLAKAGLEPKSVAVSVASS
jgi:cytosine permease